MKKKLVLLLSLLAFALSLLAVAQESPQSQQTKQKSASASQGPVEPVLPYSPGLDPASMDRSVDPCVDFYHYSCGGWQKKNPIPPDQTGWDVYSKLYLDNLNFLRGILEEAASSKQHRDAVAQEIGDFYAACMDEATAEKRGLSAIKPDLNAIVRLKSVHELAPLLARLQNSVPGTSFIFGGGSIQDPDDSNQQIAGLDQGGLGLPDRDYYTKEDAKSKEIRERYVQYVQKMFELMGDNPDAAKKNADTILRMETALAKSSLTRVERRDPYKLKNKIKVADLEQLAPNFDWQAFFREMKAPRFEIVNVVPAAFFKEVNADLTTEPLENWKTYLRFHLANGYSPYLSSNFVKENFEFYRKYLRGATEMQPRWKRCVQLVDRDLGEALGQAYVRKVFSPELKKSTLDMVKGIENAMEIRIQQLDWMGPETKQQALRKLNTIRNKIGYPDKWRDYSSVRIVRNDLVADVTRATEFESHREINKIGKPVDRGVGHVAAHGKRLLQRTDE